MHVLCSLHGVVFTESCPGRQQHTGPVLHQSEVSEHLEKPEKFVPSVISPYVLYKQGLANYQGYNQKLMDYKDFLNIIDPLLDGSAVVVAKHVSPNFPQGFNRLHQEHGVASAAAGGSSV